MRALMRIIGFLALAAAFAAPVAYVFGALDLNGCKTTMLVATFVWFAASAVGPLLQNPQAESP